jgi:hypothetical protein
MRSTLLWNSFNVFGLVSVFVLLLYQLGNSSVYPPLSSELLLFSGVICPIFLGYAVLIFNKATKSMRCTKSPNVLAGESFQ